MVAPCHETVLVVDDNDVCRAAVARLLRDAGLTVVEAAGGRDALRLLGTDFSLIILDVVLPDIDGFEVCRSIRSTARTAAIPVLMVSGIAVACSDRVHGLEAGADAFLLKPVEPAELVAHARALLRVRHAEESLEHEREFLRAVLESVGDAIIACDRGGAITLLSRAARELAGPGGEPLRADEWNQRFEACGPDGRTPLPPEDLPLARAMRGESLRDVEMVLVRCGEAARAVLATGQPLRDATGNPVGAVVALHDVTERRRLEQQYLEAQKLEAVGRLASGVAHDMNNLLTVICGYAELLLRPPCPEVPAREMVREIQGAGERGAALVRQLLAFSRQQVIAPRPLDLNAVVVDMERMLRRVIGTDVVLQTALDPGLRPVKADTGQVEQVILNLAVNARDAMPLGGTLMIATRNASPTTGPAEGRARPTVLLEVSDTGTGMTDDVKRHAFEPFFTTKDVGKGTGLGLATIQAIVRQTGGTIEVDTEPGYGTTFRIYLPATSEPVTPKSDPGPTRAPRGTETVLLVEDDDGVRSLAATILRGCGYTVVEARHGDEALAVADRHDGPIPLLVTDVVMPGLGGRELAERLAARRPQLRVLFLSGYGVDAAGVPGAKLLQKPFTAAELARRVRKVLDAPAGGI